MIVWARFAFVLLTGGVGWILGRHWERWRWCQWGRGYVWHHWTDRGMFFAELERREKG